MFSQYAKANGAAQSALYSSVTGVNNQSGRIPLFPLHGITTRVIVKIKNKEVMEVNILAFIAIALFILIPIAFLLIIYVKTASQNE
jgi:photosystem II PsbM protein